MASLSFLVLLAAVPACSELTESPYSSLTPERFYTNEGEVRAGLASVYSQLNTVVTGTHHYFNTISSDEQVIPVRGQDWFDNGRHLENQRHTWESNSPAGLSEINTAWVQAFTGISRANVLLTALEPLPVANKDRTIAETRALRAFFYVRLLDLYGGVPIVTDVAVTPRERNSSAEVFAFVESELLAARPALPAAWPSTDYGRITQGAVDAMLAQLYLNAEVWTGTVTETGLTKGTARWQDAINAADAVIAGPYTLTADQAANFRADNHTSPEIVFASTRRPETGGISFNFISNNLHYNQFSPSPNNGRAAEPPTFHRFSDADQRKAVFLVGPQNHIVTGAPVNDRSGSRLTYTIDIPDITAALEGTGTRIYKFPFDPARVTTNHGNDFPIFRLAEMYLIKAEALNELGRTPEAVPLVNLVRARVFEPDSPIALGISQGDFRTAILDERLFELLDEGKRRTDLIRLGRWNDAWFNKAATPGYRILMPIPQTQMDANPLLSQNAGY